jgi:hypothetical protein
MYVKVFALFEKELRIEKVIERFVEQDRERMCGFERICRSKPLELRQIKREE